MDTLTKKLFTTEAMSTLFSSERTLQIMLDFELGLADSLMKNGFITIDTYSVIARELKAIDIDANAIEQGALLAGNPAIPFVAALTVAVESVDPHAGSWIHYGATSQDLIDSTLMVQLREATTYLLKRLLLLEGILAGKAEKYKKTPMIGRTLLQQARPITFGYKVAGWLYDIVLLRKEIEAALTSDFQIQLGGAVGTLAAYGDKGKNVSDELAAFLSLHEALLPWHTHRKPFLRIAQYFTSLCIALGKIGKDVTLLMQTEIAEVYEKRGVHIDGSSAMPHKRNPVRATYLVAIAGKVSGRYQNLLTNALQEHERSAGSWHSEWGEMEHLAQLTDAAVEHSLQLLEGLEVDVAKMATNLGLLQGNIFSEDVTLALARKIGKSAAKKMVKEACEESLQTGVNLVSILERYDLFSREQLQAIFSVERATGLSAYFVDQLLKIR